LSLGYVEVTAIEDETLVDKLNTRSIEIAACASHEMLTMLGNKWTVLTMGFLSNHRNPVRFSRMKKGLPDISQRMLTATLRTLERDGLVMRHYYPDIPPRVEYELTSVGLEMLAALESYGCWMKASWSGIQAARRSFDERAL